MPRPTKWSPAREKQIMAALGIGATRRLAALGSGISQDTFETWCKTKPGFSEKVERAEAQAAARWLGMVEKAAAQGTWPAAVWLLEHRHAADYGRQALEIKHSGAITFSLDLGAARVHDDDAGPDLLDLPAAPALPPPTNGALH